ncbi:hypothetical protein BC351_16345 [Paenibacillus ferrarius]|uniref:Uncharacterized protein n=2 Tax=Paenibacillus ferrarius TaxID=1469647 RepID=A0A1V4HRY1_9BACL|nr:hypothetical protein BC351_16345 [Paenibacillus ferrarius]
MFLNGFLGKWGILKETNNGVKQMKIRFIVKIIVVFGLAFLLTACTLFGKGSDKQKEDTSKQKQEKSKAQSTSQDDSVINQELKKQYQMYNEIIEYKTQQEKKLIKQSEERYKKLKEESNKSDKSSSDSEQKK